MATTLPIGALVAVCSRDGSSRPALVTAADDQLLTVHVSGQAPAGYGEEVVLAWSEGGAVRELRARVMHTAPGSRELVVAASSDAVPADDDRRAVARFPLTAEALLVTDGREFSGRTQDLSVLGVGLVLEGEPPDVGAAGQLLVHDAGDVLLPGAEVQVLRIDERRERGRVALGVRFSDPARLADATERLLDVLEPH